MPVPPPLYNPNCQVLLRLVEILIFEPKLVPVPKVKIVEVENLDQTKRGHRGFGHTGH